MATLTFIEFDGTSHLVELEPDRSLMEVARDNDIPGIDADCGGTCACGTCHVIIGEEWISKTGEIGEDEAYMLSLTPEPSPGSRLACQVRLSDEHDGLVVTLPEFQM